MDSLSRPHVPLHDITAARRLDQAATALLGGDAFVLMQRAGEAAWQVVTQRWPKARRIAVVCGAGNNGTKLVMDRLNRKDNPRPG